MAQAWFATSDIVDNLDGEPIAIEENTNVDALELSASVMLYLRDKGLLELRETE